VLPEPDIALLEEDAEKALFQRVLLIAPLVRSHVANEDYADALKVLASVRAEVDRFFDEVMVNVDEPLLRGNRLGLLKALSTSSTRSPTSPSWPYEARHSRPRRRHQLRLEAVHQVAGRMATHPGQPRGHRQAQPGRLPRGGGDQPVGALVAACSTWIR
jgi:hypothetical protein